MRPPGLMVAWEDMGVDGRAMLLAYEQIRQHEDTKFEIALAGARRMF